MNSTTSKSRRTRTRIGAWLPYNSSKSRIEKERRPPRKLPIRPLAGRLTNEDREMNNSRIIIGKTPVKMPSREIRVI